MSETVLPFAKELKSGFAVSGDKEKQKNEINPFAVINNLYVTKSKGLLEVHSCFGKITPFILNRLVSSDKNSIKLAYIMSKCYEMPLRQVLLFYFYTIQRKKKHTIPYYNNVDKSYRRHLDNIVKVFQCNRTKASEYYKLLSEPDLDAIALRVKTLFDEKDEVKIETIREEGGDEQD